MKAEIADRQDIAELADLRIAYLKEDSGIADAAGEKVLRERLLPYFAAHLGKDLFVYAVRDGGRIVSCAFLLTVEKPASPSFPTGRTGTVLNVYTLPEERKKGYAKTVMNALLADAERMGLDNVELKSTDAGYPLYRSLGFADTSGRYRLLKRTFGGE